LETSKIWYKGLDRYLRMQLSARRPFQLAFSSFRSLRCCMFRPGKWFLRSLAEYPSESRPGSRGPVKSLIQTGRGPSAGMLHSVILRQLQTPRRGNGGREQEE